MNLSPSTELDAVNVLLDALGEAPVNSLTGTLPLDASDARQRIHETSRETQNRGWHWNTEIYTLSPDAEGHILLPENVLSVKATSRYVDVIDRGGKLFDKTHNNNSYTFISPVEVQLIMFLRFELMPEMARRYVTLRASRVFVQRDLSDQQRANETTTDEREAMARLESEDMRTLRLNAGTGSMALYETLNRYIT